METKREKFVRLVEARTNKIIAMIRLLGNCSNKANYDYETLERTITRAEASRILCMLYITTHNVELDTTYSLVGSFADEAAITDKTDRLAVDNCVRFGLINGHAEDNTFRPLEGLTRCQAAKILCLADNK